MGEGIEHPLHLGQAGRDNSLRFGTLARQGANRERPDGADRLEEGGCTRRHSAFEQGKKGVAFGGAFRPDQRLAPVNRAIGAILRPGATQPPQRQRSEHFRGVKGFGRQRHAGKSICQQTE